MKTVSPALMTLLQSGQELVMADLYSFKLANGTTLNYADFDVDLVANSVTYSSQGPALKRGTTRTVIGVEVDTLDVSMYPHPTDTINGVGFLAAASNGLFDGATLTLYRAFLNPVPNVVGTVILFVGDLADLSIGRTGIDIRINSALAALNIQMPRNLYQAACLHSLYDADCGASRAAFSVNSNVRSGSTALSIVTGLGQPDGWFARGYITMTGGANSGVTRTVRWHSGGTVGLLSALPAAPNVGDPFTLWPGCDKSMATCKNKFNNLGNFRGMPFVPSPETAY
jgi:uncharacterized phage protein (TIGR02218 family)